MPELGSNKHTHLIHANGIHVTSLDIHCELFTNMCKRKTMNLYEGIEAYIQPIDIFLNVLKHKFNQ